MGDIVYTIVWGNDSDRDMDRYVRSGNIPFLKKMDELIDELTFHPCQGKGIVKQMKGNMKGLYSRRIVGKHRLLYRINEREKEVTIVKVGSHYGDK